MGNTVLWKPASTAVFSNYYIMKLLQAAGLPDGVINFLPGKASQGGRPGAGPSRLRGHPLHRLDPGLPGDVEDDRRQHRQATAPTRASSARRGARTSSSPTPRRTSRRCVTALVRGSFEYQGQKCSAGSRAYVPRSLWAAVARAAASTRSRRSRWARRSDFRNFMAAVIDEQLLRPHHAATSTTPKSSSEAEILAGGKGDKSEGYFIEPTVVVTTDPRFKLMREEIFGPVVTVFVYEDAEIEETLELVDTTSPYALTGAIFAAGPQGRRRTCRGASATRPATSTSTTSRPAPWWASSPSAAPAPRAPTTRRARWPTCCAGPRSGRSRRPSCRRGTSATRSWARSR